MAGFFLGTMFLPAALRWGLLAHTALTKQEGDFLGAPRRRLLWFAPFVFLFHPFPYLIAGLFLVSGLALLGRLSTSWLWLLGGFYAYALVLALLAVPRILKLRARTRDARKL